jgi:CRISPR-associated protein Csx17
MSTHELVLAGCTPEPLMSYLKALGVLRLVAEQKDANALGCWCAATFVLRSTLDWRSLQRFFLDEYQPTPIVAPWNAGSGFYLKWDDKRKTFRRRDAVTAVDNVWESTSERLLGYRTAIASIKKGLGSMARPLDLGVELANKTKDEKRAFLDAVLVFEVAGDTVCLTKADKDRFLADLRSRTLNDDSLWWIDAALALTVGRKKNRHEAPLLGSGGNVGNSDFSAMFAQMIPEIMPLADGSASPQSEGLLAASLRRDPVPLPAYPIGQFNPGEAGGANQTQGFESSPQMNPWDYVLMCEGALLMGGAISRRTETGPTGASFPFTVRSSAVGYGSAGCERTRGETWLPLWTRPASARELGAMLREGRVDLAGKPARNGVEFARALSMLGIERGVTNFIRYGYQERLGQSYLATPLGSFEVHARPDADLLCGADRWLDRFRGAASGDNAPARFVRALRAIESSIFAFCQHGGVERFANVLCAFGRAERELAHGERFGDEKHLRPLAGLSTDWIRASNDASVEFDLALALAGIWDPSRKVGPLRANLESVTWHTHDQWRGYTDWAKKDRAVVWSSADLSTNLAAVLDRRVMDAGRKGCLSLPLGFRWPASLEAISRFLVGDVDEERLENLLWGLLLVDHSKKYPHLARPRVDDAQPLPRAYALLKLLFLPHPFGTSNGEVVVKPEPAVLALVRTGRVGEACVLAVRRLRASGLVPMPHMSGRRKVRDDEWEGVADTVNARRLGAALLFPVSHGDVHQGLMTLVLRRGLESVSAVG